MAKMVRWSCGESDIEPEVHDVAVLHLVGLSFDAELADTLQCRLAAVLEQVGDGVDLGLDEAALKVGVDRPRRLGR
jgi:hypothetical protein